MPDPTSSAPASLDARPRPWRMTITAFSVTVLLGLVGAASCAEQTPPEKTPEDLRAESPTLRDNPRLRIGVRENLPLVSYRDPETGAYSGFEIEIARAVAEELGYPENRLTWVPITILSEREDVLQSGRADMVVASFTMTEERERFVDFAGPYLLVPQAVLVRRDRSESLETVADLGAADVRVCALTASTSEAALRDQGITPELVNTHADCMAGLRAEQYDAFSSDLHILAGFMSEDPERFEILELAIARHSELIGIAVPDGDTAMRDLVAWHLHQWREGPEGSSPWLRAYDRTLGPFLDPKHRSQPLVDTPPMLVDFDSRAPRG